MLYLRQADLADWQDKNFGVHDDDLLAFAVGMAEEVGEVCHHILKGRQGIREGVNGIDKAEVLDGVTDTLIYGLQILSRLGIDAEKEMPAIIQKVLSRNWVEDPETGGN